MTRQNIPLNQFSVCLSVCLCLSLCCTFSLCLTGYLTNISFSIHYFRHVQSTSHTKEPPTACKMKEVVGSRWMGRGSRKRKYILEKACWLEGKSSQRVPSEKYLYYLKRFWGLKTKLFLPHGFTGGFKKPARIVSLAGAIYKKHLFPR